MGPFPGFPFGQWRKGSRPRRSKTITFSLPSELESQARQVLKEDDPSISELLRQASLAYRFRTSLKVAALFLRVRWAGAYRITSFGSQTPEPEFEYRSVYRISVKGVIAQRFRPR